MTKTVEQIEKAINTYLNEEGVNRDAGRTFADMGMDEIAVVEMILDLEERLETGVEITLEESDILKMTVNELAVAIAGFLEAQEL